MLATPATTSDKEDYDMHAMSRLIAQFSFLRCLTLLAWLLGTTSPALAALLSCDGPFFIEAIAESAWVNIDLSPATGTSGIRQALATARDSYPNQAVRIRLAPGVYPDDVGAEIYAQRLLRTASTPIYLKATDPAPNATQLGHGINLLGVSYIAIDGVTIGPPVVGAWNGSVHAAPLPLQAAAGIHVAGAAKNASANANVGGTLDASIYGQYEPAHHILIRAVTIQNLFDPADLDGETAMGFGSDGIKFNQAEDIWVINSRISQTTRHGIDNVGLHRGAFCNNVIAHSGGGQGIEAKGGSTDVLYDSNLFYRVRRVELGGESTDATYYFSLDGRWNYEALGTLARNNLIIDPRETALEFSGCANCLALGNSVFFSASYVPPLSGNDAAGGDAIRIHDSIILAAADGAGNDCQSWDAGQNDYVTIDPCWGVGANLPAPVNRVLRTSAVSVQNNLFAASGAQWGHSYGGTTVACTLNVIDGSAALLFKANYWWNGASALPTDQCSPLPLDADSIGAAGQITASPLLAQPLLGAVSLAGLADAATLALTPASISPLAGRAVAHAMAGSTDFKKLTRSSPASIGAIEALTLSSGGTLNLQVGWNLLGNGQEHPLAVATVLGNPLNVSTVWKWDATITGWQFYAPSMDATVLQTYATSKGYGVLSSINAGEGFWVKAVQAFASTIPAGVAITVNDFQADKPYALKPGWNLIAIGNAASPSAFNLGLSATTPTAGVVPLNLTTLWAWDNPLSKWYFYAPMLEAVGGTALFDYATSKGHLDFTTTGKQLGPAVGFWVNNAQR